MRCRLNDIAVITHDPDHDSRDAGVIVEIVGYGINGDDWRCRSLGRRLRFFRLGFVPWWSHDGLIPDAWLRPLRGIEGRDESFAWVVEHAFKAKEHA